MSASKCSSRSGCQDLSNLHVLQSQNSKTVHLVSVFAILQNILGPRSWFARPLQPTLRQLSWLRSSRFPRASWCSSCCKRSAVHPSTSTWITRKCLRNVLRIILRVLRVMLGVTREGQIGSTRRYFGRLVLGMEWNGMDTGCIKADFRNWILEYSFCSTFIIYTICVLVHLGFQLLHRSYLKNFANFCNFFAAISAKSD